MHRHDNEIEAGADIALVKNLVFLKFQATIRRHPMKFDMKPVIEEISTLLKCLECVYRYDMKQMLQNFA